MPSTTASHSAPSPAAAATSLASREHKQEHDVGRWLASWADRQPRALAWVDETRRCDYAEAHDRVSRLVTWLSDQGVASGDRIAVWLGNRAAMLETLFAAARIGAIMLPVNARLTPAEVAFQFDDASPTMLLVESAWRHRAESVAEIMTAEAPRVLEVGGVACGDAYERALASSTPSSDCAAVGPDHPMILMYTSGTTGKPKGALLPRRKTLYNCRNAQVFFDLATSDRVLVVAPLFHSLGLQILALPAVYSGASVFLQDGFDTTRVWSTIEAEGVTYYGGVPTVHQRLLDALNQGVPVATPPKSLRFAFSAGAAASAELIRAYHRHGLLLKQGYGQTETSLLTCIDADRALTHAGSVGRPVLHGELRLVTPETIQNEVADWCDAPPGVVGEIVVRGPITMLGYWRRPQETAETLRGEWLRTGDLATRDGDFYVTLVGRAREMYISGGENVYPAEVEATIAEHPDIAEVAVVSFPDAEWGESGRAHIVLVAGHSLRPEALTAWLGTRLARFKQPREIVVETALPRTASGKVQKHRLAETAAEKAEARA